MTNKELYDGLKTRRTVITDCLSPLCASQTKFNQQKDGLNSWQHDAFDDRTIGSAVDQTSGTDHFKSNDFSVVFE